jgi:PadR family transcriptional regulator PadR
MPRREEFSAQALSVLAALCAEPRAWLHGYGIAKGTGLKSGSLYPILIRLADRGLVEARWEEEQPAGRPRRHLYRLTRDGVAQATAALAEQPASQYRRASAAGRAGRRRVATEGT